MKNNHYKSISIIKISINFGVREGTFENKPKVSIDKHQFQNYKHYKLPVTLNPLEYGTLIKFYKESNEYLVQITPLTQSNIKVKESENLVEIIKSGHIILIYQDRKINNTSFERIIGNNKYIYVIKTDNKYKLDLFTFFKPINYIKSKKHDKQQNK